jgi:hypothetical protein
VLPIVDLSIEEPPLEEVMRELFRARGADPSTQGQGQSGPEGTRAHG